MIRLLKIDLLKNLNFKAFLIMVAMYFISLGAITASGMEFLKWLKDKGVEFDTFNPLRIPIYHFPDIWHNLAYIGTFFKFILAIVVIISITNEFSYKTIRQNIIDGLDRWDFLKSKIITITLLSIAATIFLFLIALITGLIYTPSEDMRFLFKGVEFVGGFFLETFSFLLFALLIGTLVKRSGFAIGILFLYTLIVEPIATFNLPDQLDFLIPYFPVRAMNEVVKVPFPKYIFMEIRDYMSINSIVVLVPYCVLFIYFTYLLLRKRDLQ